MLEQTITERSMSLQARSEALPSCKAEMEELTGKEAKFTESTDALDTEIKAQEVLASECSEVERTRERELVRFRNCVKDERRKLMDIEKRLGNLGSEAQALRTARADLLKQSVLEDIEIPLLNGEFEALQDLAEAPSQPASAPTQRPMHEGDEADFAVDFRSLAPEKQAASSGPAAKMLEEEYRSEVSRLAVELERLSPNLKAIDQMAGVTETVTHASTEAEMARREIEDIETRFEAVRKARKERFVDCFGKVQAAIGETYRRLTANTAGLGADGGSAYLDLENTEDPFAGGVKFTAMPPAKRFRDMHLLSGGEKTLAAMALLFAVQAYQRPPFMVLDEVDAALDANNGQSLANYVEHSECQTIVISLKDKFFARSEALIGVYKDKPKETSGVLTLDLSRYQQ